MDSFFKVLDCIVIFQNALILQRRKLEKSGDFSGSAEILLNALGGSLSNPTCGSAKLDNTSLPLSEYQFSFFLFLKGAQV
jgi:hypothetical protein